MLRRILIANRGEIAERIQRTCRRLGVETVAVYSEADAERRFVGNADQAIAIGPANASDSYLNIERLVAAAKQSGAEAVHPGYGFLAENADFARACAREDLIFIGPDVDTLELMGSKTRAKQTVEAAGVACVPGYHGDEQGDARLRKEAQIVGLPLLLKASAGGGGKGMRIVRQLSDFDDACAGARREATSAFGDGRLLIEKYLERPRHVEVQVFGDHHGHIVHLFERECSVQRRYQKVIEEAPAAYLRKEQRAALYDAAIRVARAVDYTGAGTIEFILDGDGHFYFMEMNTRLQVEHAVTEMITGVDLVEWQLRIASGAPLPLPQDQITRRGHAVQARLYAEDPFNGFLPAAGKLQTFDTPPENDSLRLDSGVRAGDTVGSYYDPMLAKLIVHGDTRSAAVARLADALDNTAIFGLRHNLPLLRAVTRHEAFVRNQFDTALLDRQGIDLSGGDHLKIAAATAAGALSRTADLVRHPWQHSDGWQANGAGSRRFRLRFRDGKETTVGIPKDPAEPVAVGDTALARSTLPRLRRFWQAGDELQVLVDGHATEFRLLPLYERGADGEGLDIQPGAPMPGRIVKVLVAAGDVVAAGDPLVIMEGMKMEFSVTAAVAGTVADVLFGEGDQVDAEAALVRIVPLDGAADEK